MGDHVFAGIGASPLDELGEVAKQVGDALGGAHVALRCGGHDLLGPAVESDPVLWWYAEVVGDDEGGKRLEEAGDEVATADLAELLDAFDGEGSDSVLEFGHLTGREALADEPAHGGVVGWVHEDDRRGVPHLGAGRGLVDGEAVGRREGVGVADRREDVVEAGEEPEGLAWSAGLDPVYGVVVAQRPVHGEGVPP